MRDGRGVVGLVIAALAITATSLRAGPATEESHRAYAPQPLHEPIRDVAENTVEFVKFNNWLNGNLASIAAERMQAYREHLYSIIDSDVKQLYARSGVTYPEERDLVLEVGFRWAARMGVPGADLVAKRLDPEGKSGIAEPSVPPESFDLRLDGDRFLLSSKLGRWSVAFPYYFMIGGLMDQTTTGGLRTQVAIVSTGFGRHSDGKEYSQATIMVMYSPEGERGTYVSYWLGMLGLGAGDRRRDEAGDRTAYERYDVESRMHARVEFPQIGKGVIAVSIMGLDGTYQWNRPHFDDFLASLRDSTPPAQSP